MKKRALVCLLLISMVLQPMTSVLATEVETPTLSSEEKETEETLERPLDTMTQELLESEPTTEEEVNNAETPTETTDSIDEPEAPIDIEPPAPTPETLSAPRAVTTVPWGQTICTIEGIPNYYTGYTITVRAGSGTMTGVSSQAPWKTNEDYKTYTYKIIFDGNGGKIQLVGDQSYLFEGLHLRYTDFSDIDTSQVTNMSNMFNGSSGEECDLSSFDTSHVTNMSGMFKNCYSVRNPDLSHFDTRLVTDMSNMFNGCNRFLTDLDLSSFDTHAVTDMSNMFNDCKVLINLDLSSFDTSHVTNMSNMFNGCGRLTNPVLNIDTRAVTNMSGMFNGCSNLTNPDLSSFDTRHVTNMKMMFASCSKLSNLDISHFDTSHVTNMNMMFSGCSELSNLNVSHFDTRQVTIMSAMFVGCSKLKNLDLSSFDTRRVTVMNSLFVGCSGLTSLDISNFDTRAVTSMSGMFNGCSRLINLDLSHFDTRLVTNMSNMFASCRKLSSLDVSHFDTRQVTDMSYMFENCGSLKSLDLSSFIINITNYFFLKDMFRYNNDLKCLKLGSQTKVNFPMNPPQNNLYTGKWVTVGNGTEQFPQGTWSGNAGQLSQRSKTGVADTYVWEPRKYTINFHANGGSNVPNPIVDYIDKAIDLTNLATPTPPTPFYEFIGWSTVINNPSTIVSSLTIPTKNVTLYANWKLFTLELTTVPDCFVFSNEVTRNEYTSQIISLSESAYGAKADFQTKWRGILDWKLTVTMAEWCNPDDNTDTLTGVQMFMNNQFTRRNGSPAPSTIHSNQQVVLNAGETQTLVTTTTGNSADGMGSWQSTIDFDSVKLKIPRYGGREGSYYTSQLTWSLDDTI
ncbi:BspA family leucine-rich repeat surface protein [Vagococcus lutrae]|uniref:BspA family leucine-rich repeat surface protein n=1 Tax=Vagococcus lutrae TaxID=81947 RepID=UPI00201093D3|nr:BspA family leucine-rich repeat surface protein [Vagococcus lutrae]UQF22629.1 BspA family leucine-rich repeat surface protein [Vagococcus lutrae]UQF63452.1 BspA family leucine-rich repeat surface protein [Vagococcus lutrae]